MQQPAIQPVPLRRRLPVALLALGAAVLLSACMPKTPVRPPYGLIYTGYKAPLQTDLSQLSPGQNSANPENAAKPTVANGKVGVSDTSFICIWPISSAISFGWKDAAIRKAAENGGLKKVYYTDYETYSILGIYVNFKVYAYGE